MKLYILFASLLLSIIVFDVVSVAHAHISLEQGGTHKSRYGDSEIKDGVCGRAAGTRGTNIYTYEPGQTITVKLVEYIGHPSYYRWAFDNDGDDGFKDPVSIKPIDATRGCPASNLVGDAAMRDQCMKDDFYNTPEVLPTMDDLDPHSDAPSGKLYEFTIKLPDVECDNCTLQVIQVMEDASFHGPYNVEVSGAGDLEDVYHQCIDLVLKRGSGSGSAGSAASGGAPASAGTGASAGGSASVSASGGSVGAGAGGATPGGAPASAAAGTVASAAGGSVASGASGAPASAAAGRSASATGSGGGSASTTPKPASGSAGNTVTATSSVATAGAASPSSPTQGGVPASSSGGCSVAIAGRAEPVHGLLAVLFGTWLLSHARPRRRKG
jgi:hypothetical protein